MVLSHREAIDRTLVSPVEAFADSVGNSKLFDDGAARGGKGHVGGSGFWRSLFNGTNVFMALGILFLPYTMRLSGWVGLILLGLVAVMTIYITIYTPKKKLWEVVPPKRDGRKRVLFLLSDTGGGHKASAKAIEMALEELYPGKFLSEICDIYTDYGKGPFTTLMPFYQWAAKNPWAWRIVYFSGQVNHEGWRAYMEKFAPDIVVSVHPLCQEVPLRILKNMGNGERKIPFVTVVTDLGGAHNMWFNKDVDKCCVPGDEIERIALRRGLRPDQIKKHGLPVRAGFWDAASKKKDGSKAVKAKLGLKDVRTVLVAGGGDGVGGLQRVAVSVGENLGTLEGPTQMVVICGKNEKVANALRDRKWQGDVNVVVHGFVSNMDEWMIASDCLVTKAGPGTIAEASIVGLPTMLSGFLPGQEAGNVPYVINAGFGDFSKEPKKIGETVAHWLSTEDALTEMSRKATEVGRRHARATKEIAVEIASLLT